MHIVMIKTEFGSPDGIQIHRFMEGQIYDIDLFPMSRELARSFVQAKVAELVRETNSSGPTEDKNDASAVAAKPKKQEELEDETSEVVPAPSPKKNQKERLTP